VSNKNFKLFIFKIHKTLKRPLKIQGLVSPPRSGDTNKDNFILTVSGKKCTYVFKK
jgi:hypothetical protein